MLMQIRKNLVNRWGDIIANKKTYLLIKAFEKANAQQKQTLTHWLSLTKFNKNEKVEAVKKVYDELSISALANKKINSYFNKGFKSLDAVKGNVKAKAALRTFAEDLIDRQV